MTIYNAAIDNTARAANNFLSDDPSGCCHNDRSYDELVEPLHDSGWTVTG
jgi:hypothetical protein